MKCNQCAKSFIIYANNSSHTNATFDCCCHQPQMLTQSIAGNERNFASALLHTNEISKHSTKLRLKIRFTKRNIFRNFARCFAQSGEISNMSRQKRFEISSKLRRPFVSFEISLVFAYIRRNSTKFVEIRSYYFCTVL